MKRFLLIFLACVCIVCMNACGETPDTPEDTLPQATEAPITEVPSVTEAPVTEVPSVTEAPVTEVPSVTEAPATEAPQVDVPSVGDMISTYVADITFDYPKSWGFMTDNIAQDSATGNNINITTEAKNAYYDTLDTATYIEQVVPIYETMNMAATNVSVEHVENSRGVKIVKIEMTMTYVGITMEMTQFVFTSGDSTYTITVTEVVPVPGLADFVFESIRIG